MSFGWEEDQSSRIKEKEGARLVEIRLYMWGWRLGGERGAEEFPEWWPYFFRKSRLGHVLTISSYGAVLKAPGDQKQGATLRKRQRTASSTWASIGLDWPQITVFGYTLLLLLWILIYSSKLSFDVISSGISFVLKAIHRSCSFETLDFSSVLGT